MKLLDLDKAHAEPGVYPGKHWRFSKVDRKAYKCTLCSDRVAVGQAPACAKACPTQAIYFGSKEDMLVHAERRVTDSTRPINTILTEMMDSLEELFDRGNAITGTSTGFIDLDEILNGLQPSTLNIIGARPAMGKTALGLGMALNVAKTTRKPVMVFSLEMGHVELTQRILSGEAEVDSQRIRTGGLQEADWSKLGRAINRLDDILTDPVEAERLLASTGCELEMLLARAAAVRNAIAAASASMSLRIRSHASRSCSASAVSNTSDEVRPKCSQRAAGPTHSATAVVNAMTSCCVTFSISSMRAMLKAPLSRRSLAASAGTMPASAIASAAATSTWSHVS